MTSNAAAPAAITVLFNLPRRIREKPAEATLVSLLDNRSFPVREGKLTIRLEKETGMILTISPCP